MPPFHTTRWSLVADASASAPDLQRRALGELVEAYWVPLYAFARRSGETAADAQDLVQSFLTELIEKGRTAQADPERGRFRTFLIAAFRHHASKARERARAKKRGGGVPPLSLDFDDGERRYADAPSEAPTPEAVFERQWALAVLGRALERLAIWYRGGSSARAERFEVLRSALGDGEHQPYRDLAERLGISETAVKVEVHRMRGRLRTLLREEVSDTLDEGAPVDDELHTLLAALRSS